jgi:hypothetical protein
VHGGVGTRSLSRSSSLLPSVHRSPDRLPVGQPALRLLSDLELPEHCEGGLYLEEENTSHPEQVPLLALRQVDENGVLWGEVWFLPAELPKLIAELTKQLEMNYSRSSRHWRGLTDGPLMNLGEPDPDTGN